MTEGHDDEPAAGPTVRRMLLGAQLRRLREAKGVSRRDAGWEIRASESKISRLELGRVSVKERDVADLLTRYGVVDEDQRATLLALARQANLPGWWQLYSDLLPGWFQSYLDLEAVATVIRTYEVQFVPGLLQTRDYARAVIMLGHGMADAAEVDRRVELRMARQALFSQRPAQRLWCVVDETALRRPIGGLDVWRAQIKSLAEVTRLPNIRLQVVPFEVGGHAGAGGAFTMLRFGEPELPDVVYIEQLTSALYLDKRYDVDHYAAVMEQLSFQARPPRHTPEILDRILHDAAA